MAKEKKPLRLILKGEWFDMILSGEKKEEYREDKLYWETRFIDTEKQNVLDAGPTLETAWRDYETVEFFHGYRKDRRSFTIELKGIEMRTGKPEWGAEKGVTYFVLLLGKILE